MTSVNREKQDGKLLLVVAGVVVVGAVGIALLASLQVDRESQDGPAAQIPARETTSARAVPALAPTEVAEPAVLPASFEKTPGTVGPDIEAAAEAIVVDPAADLTAVGLEAYAARDFAKAAAYFEAQCAARPDRAWTHYMLGLSLWKDGRPDAAVQAMQRSIELDPRCVKAFVNLARIQNDRGEFDAALHAAEQGLALEPENAEARFLQGRTLRNLGRLEDAKAALEQSLLLDPENGYAANLLGLMQIESGDFAAAADTLSGAVALQPDVAYFHNNLGMALELTDRRAEAVEAYRRAVELDPAHTRAAVNLARLGPTVPAPAEGREVEETSVAEVRTDGETGEVAEPEGSR